MADLAAVDHFIADLNTDGLEWLSAVTGKPSPAYDPRVAPLPVAVQTPGVATIQAIPGGIALGDVSGWLLLGALALGAYLVLRS